MKILGNSKQMRQKFVPVVDRPSPDILQLTQGSFLGHAQDPYCVNF